MKVFLVFAFLGFFIFGCKTTNNSGSSAKASSTTATSSPTSDKNFVGIGDKGRSGKFNNVLTVYVNAKDPQPRCIGCKRFRVVYDARSQNETIGGTFAIKVGANLSKICDNAAEPTLADLTAIWRYPISPTTAALTVEVNPMLCRSDTFAIEFYGENCLNPSSPDCDELVVKESFDVSMNAIGNLTPIEGDGTTLLPNQSK